MYWYIPDILHFLPGRIIPEYSDEDDEDEFDGGLTYDAEYYLTADDPSMYEYEDQWMS